MKQLYDRLARQHHLHEERFKAIIRRQRRIAYIGAMIWLALVAYIRFYGDDGWIVVMVFLAIMITIIVRQLQLIIRDNVLLYTEGVHARGKVISVEKDKSVVILPGWVVFYEFDTSDGNCVRANMPVDKALISVHEIEKEGAFDVIYHKEDPQKSSLFFEEQDAMYNLCT